MKNNNSPRNAMMNIYLTVFKDFARKLACYRQFLANRAKEFTVAAALVGLGGFSQAYAFSIGDLTVRSRLGQPLDAIVQISAAPGETLRADCFSLKNPGDGALPPVTNVHLTLTSSLSGGTALRLRGRDTLREPISELILRVDCKGTPNVTRTFLVLLDPPADSDLRPGASTAAATGNRVAGAATRGATSSVAPLAPHPVADIVSESPRVRVRPSYLGPNEPIRPGSIYIVQPGDVLSMVASRLAGRGEYTVWPIAESILRANPAAFENGDPDLLLVGAQLAIPAMQASWLADGSAMAPPSSLLSAAATASVTARGELSIPAPPSPLPEPVKSTVTTRAALRPAAVGNAGVPLPEMVLTQRLSGVSRERLRLRRSGQIQVLPTAVTQAPPEPQQPQQPTAPAAPAPVSTSTVARTEFKQDKGFASGLMSWILLLVGIAVGVAATAFGLRSSTQRRIETEVAARVKSEQYQEDLERNRKSRDTIRPEETIIVDEQLAPTPVAQDVEKVAEVDVNSVSVPTRAQIEQQIQELAQVEDEVSEALAAAPQLPEDAEEDEFEFELFEEPNALDLEMLARDYAESVSDIAKLEEQERAEAGPMLDAATLGLVPEGTEIMSTALDLELPEEQPSPPQAVHLDVGEAPSHDDLTLTEQVLPTYTDGSSPTMEIDAGLLALTQFASQAKNAGESPTEFQSDPEPQSEDPQDFYHLEASSIMPAGELEFEADHDADESKVLEFRHPGKTGTDDSSAEG